MDKDVQDSLDKFPKTAQENQHLRTAFQRALDKIVYSDTRERGMLEIRNLIRNHNEPSHLTVFLKCLKQMRPSSDPNVKQHQVIVVALISEVFKQNLTDPSDRPAQLKVTFMKVFGLILKYFNVGQASLQQACARAVLQLYKNCGGQFDQLTRKQLVFERLCGVILNHDKISQSTAAVCLNQLVQHYLKQDLQMAQLISRQFSNLFCKVGLQYYLIIQTFSLLVQKIGLDHFKDKLNVILKALRQILTVTDQKMLQTLPGYMARVAASDLCCCFSAQFKTIISDQLKAQAGQIYIQLNRLSKNRITLLQKSASKGLRAWTQLLSEQYRSELDQIKTALQQSVKQSPIRKSLNQRRNQRRISNSKQREERLRKLDLMSQNLQDLVKGKGWGANARGHNFVKRGTGSGGGNIFDDYSQEIKQKNQSFIQQSKQLKQQIKRDRSNKKKRQPQESEQNRPNQEEQFKPQKVSGEKAVLKKGINSIDKKRNYNKLVQKIYQHGTQISNALNSLEKQLEKQPEGSHQQDRPNQQIVTIESPPALPKEIERESKQEDSFVPQKSKGDKAVKLSPKSQNGRLPLNQAQLSKIIEESGFQKMSSGVQNMDLEQANLQSFNSADNQRLFKKAQAKVNFRIQKSQKDSVDLNYSQTARETKLREMNSLKFNSFGHQSHQSHDSPQVDQELFQSEEIVDVKHKPTPQPDRTSSPQAVSQIVQLPKALKPLAQKRKAQRALRDKEEDSRQKLKDLVQTEVDQVFGELKNQIQDVKGLLKQISSVKKQKRQDKKQAVEIAIQTSFQPQQAKQPPQPQPHLPSPPKLNPQSKVSGSTLERIPAKKSKANQKGRSVDAIWRQALLMCQKGHINQAYSLILDTQDQIYLLRLLLLHGMPTRHLTPLNIKRFAKAFLHIYQTSFLDNMTLTLFQEAAKMGTSFIQQSLTLNQTRAVLNRLYDMSASQDRGLSFRSACLYNSIQRINGS